MTEFRKAGIRIASNYVRLLAFICFGVALVPLLLRTVGQDAYGLIALLTSTAGFAIILEEIVGWSMIRELGAAHHSGDAKLFSVTYNSAVAVCAAAAVLTLVAFGVILAIVPILDIPHSLVSAARWFVVAKAAESAVMVLLAPQFNMYLATERMVAYNGWFILKRASHVIAAISLFWWVPPDAASGLVRYGWLSSGMQITATVASVLAIMMMDSRLVPNLARVTRSGIHSILSISGWNVAILGSQLLGLPAGAFVMNLSFGLFGNRIFAISSQLAGYTRMVASGMTGGLDAVSARLSTTGAESAAVSMQRLVHHSTKLHAFAALPAAVAIFMLARPLLQVWLGSSFAPGAPEINTSVVLTRLLVLGFVVMTLGDNWMRILYGAGHIRQYAIVAMIGGLVHLPLAGLFLIVLPSSVKFACVALAFSLMYLVFHLGIVPRIVARAFNLRYGDVFEPMVRPALAATITAPLLGVFLWRVPTWNVWWLGAAGGAYALGYAALAWWIVLRRNDRERLTSAILNLGRLNGRTA